MATKKKTTTKKKAAKKKKKKAPAKKKTSTTKKKALTKKKKAPTKAPKKKAAAASNKALYDRLLVKEHTLHVVDPPVGFEMTVPVGCAMGFELPAKLGGDDVLFAFVKDKAAVDALAKKLAKALTPPTSKEEALLWLAYPKGTGRVKTDISRDKGWEAMKALGYEGVALVAVDDDWSAFRLRHQSRTARRA